MFFFWLFITIAMMWPLIKLFLMIMVCLLLLQAVLQFLIKGLEIWLWWLERRPLAVELMKDCMVRKSSPCYLGELVDRGDGVYVARGHVRRRGRLGEV